MKSKVVAVTAASVLGSLGVVTASSGVAHATAPPPSSGAAVASLPRTGGNLQLSKAESQHIAALQSTSDTTLGAVTFVDEDLNGPTALDFSVAQGTTAVGSLDLDAGAFTAPQLLPAGTYTLTVADASDSASSTTATVTVTAGQDISEVVSDLAPSATTPPPTTPPPTTPPTSSATGPSTPATSTPTLAAQVTSYTDAVNTVPSGQATISVRNLSYTAAAVDVYVNGTKVASDLSPTATGVTSDVAIAPGTANVVVVPTGDSPTTDTPLFSGTLSVAKDSYNPLYLVDDSTQSTGVNANATEYLQGYEYVASDGGLFNYGSYPFLGSTGSLTLNQPMVGGAEATNGSGYWLVASDGGIFTFGNVPFLGSLGSLHLNSPIVGMAATTGSNGQPGYLLVGADGGVFAFNASYYGSLASQAIDSPVVGIAADPTTGSYTIAEANGEWFTFGPSHNNSPATGQVAASAGSPVVGIAETPDGGGFWLVSNTGGVFPEGNAPFEGSAGNLTLNKPVTSIVPTYDGLGYDLIAADGGVFSYGDAQFFGSTGNIVLNKPIVGAVNF